MSALGCPMQRVVVQFYEIQDRREAEIVLACGADHVGSVILDANRWKDPEIKNAVTLVQASGARSVLIPLFSSTERILQILDYYHPDIVHFCENITPAAVPTLIALQREVKRIFPQIQVMRSIPVRVGGSTAAVDSLQIARAFEPESDFFLTDTLLTPGGGADGDGQPVTGFVGITGRVCDWAVAAQLVQQSQIPVVLAGGLDPDDKLRLRAFHVHGSHAGNHGGQSVTATAAHSRYRTTHRKGAGQDRCPTIASGD